ncbi:Hypothetical Protein FCC1311_097322 [Hondaea fermentalgiana]|uniref:Uncharacterized protein n=1 Tax=Hondaea fermentalgiana TaxID=2315210 RepID=A0A2R5GT62_9STRA|nr:Hypothetical Protein FCC1311_097322 [Hondaea fermentalgiana]|eukprot:GBG33509.1 Hypothetical Protein FCC1311_097322 [Hondaea fermentalgiana]
MVWATSKNLEDVWDAFADDQEREADEVCGELGLSKPIIVLFLQTKARWTESTKAPWRLWKLVLAHHAFERKNKVWFARFLAFALARERLRAPQRPRTDALSAYKAPPQTPNEFIRLMVLLATSAEIPELELETINVLFGAPLASTQLSTIGQDTSNFISTSASSSLQGSLRTNFMRHVLTALDVNEQGYQHCVLYIFYTLNMYALGDEDTTKPKETSSLPGIDKQQLRRVLNSMRTFPEKMPRVESDQQRYRLIVSGTFVCDGAEVAFRAARHRSKPKALMRLDAGDNDPRSIPLTSDAIDLMANGLKGSALLTLGPYASSSVDYAGGH